MIRERWNDGLLPREFRRSSSERFSLLTEIHDIFKAFELKRLIKSRAPHCNHNYDNDKVILSYDLLFSYPVNDSLSG